MNEALQPRHIQMRRQYDGNRYARHLSQPELDRRIRDILLNLITLTSEAKVGHLPIDEGAVWFEKWIHMLEEMQLRHGPYPAGFSKNILHSEPLPEFASTLAQKAANAHKGRMLEPGSFLIKYGQRNFTERLFYEGDLRIQQAGYFTNEKFNGAVRDDERRLPLSFALSREEVVKVVKNPQDVPEHIPSQRVDAAFISPANYWLYCLTASLNPRHFVDFKYDSCVVIWDCKQFAERLRRAASTVLGKVEHQAKKVNCVDPLFPEPLKILLPFAKHFGYTYQSEYRFCWFPRRPSNELQHKDLSLGSLQEIADLIVL